MLQKCWKSHKVIKKWLLSDVKIGEIVAKIVEDFIKIQWNGAKVMLIS